MMTINAESQNLTILQSTETDAQQFIQQMFLCCGLMYLHLGLALTGYLPAWTLLLSTPILISRWIISIHEVFHLRKVTEVGFWTRLMPFILTPLSLGYREYQNIHQRHHRFSATAEDPEYYQIQGSKLTGLINAMTAPEQAYFRWINQNGLDGPLLQDSLIRLVLFTAIAGLGIYWGGWACLWYWVPLRLAHGISYFIFFYCLHRRGPEYGVYPLHFPPLLGRLIALFLGRTLLSATCHHDIHHAHPWIAAVNLPEVRQASEV